MQLGMIGLGRMGANMVRRLMKGGHECVAFDMTPASVQALTKEGATGAGSLDDFISKLKQPRAICVRGFARILRWIPSKYCLAPKVWIGWPRIRTCRW